MAIQIKFKGDNTGKLYEVKEILHNALAGSPAYVESEIAICDSCESSSLDPNTNVVSSSGNEFFLVIGNNNSNNVGIELDIDDINLEDIHE